MYGETEKFKETGGIELNASEEDFFLFQLVSLFLNDLYRVIVVKWVLLRYHPTAVTSYNRARIRYHGNVGKENFSSLTRSLL